MATEFDYIIAGAGSAGCTFAYRLSQLTQGTICVLEAGGSDSDPRVRIPLWLVNLMGSRMEWNHQSAPQKASQNRQIKIPRGKMVGGSSSINSMVWFRGCPSDFTAWNDPAWSSEKTAKSFDAIEEHIQPIRLTHPHPLAESFARAFGANDPSAPPTPSQESAGVFHTNMRNGARWSATDAFLRPAQKTGRVTLLTNTETDHIVFADAKATGIRLVDGRSFTASRGVILSAGAIQSPMILMRSGIGPSKHLQDHGIPIRIDAPDVGANLRDHPACGLHFAGANSGYGVTVRQLGAWVSAPFKYFLTGSGVWASNTVEAGTFFRSDGGNGVPDVQTHFIPFMLGWKGKRITTGSGYFADVCVCCPKSRGRLSLGRTAFDPVIDLNLSENTSDLDILEQGLIRLRTLLDDTDLGNRRAPEAYPLVTGHSLRDHIRNTVATAYHPVGTCALGAVLNSDLSVKKTKNLFVADASVMPSITSANKNAPSMMIGWHAAQMIAKHTQKDMAA